MESTYHSATGKEIKPLTEEEAGAYFSDDRSIDEVMDAIENREELWLKESN